MLTHVTGHIMTKNENENAPVLVLNPVRCDGYMPGTIGDFLTKHDAHVMRLYQAKCELMKKGIGGRGDIQHVCMFTNFGYALCNAFVFYNTQEPAVDSVALHRALHDICFYYPNDTVRIPYKFGVDMTDGGWRIISGIIINRLVNHDIDVEIWHEPDTRKE